MDSRVEPGPSCERGAPVTIRFDGRAVRAYEGETVGAALHAEGERVLMRSIRYHRPRGLFCNTGACANCLVRVEGTPNVRACTTPVHDGMVVESQNAFPSARRDVLAVVDKVYRKGLDMHGFFAKWRLVRPPFHAVVRRMAGFGKLPDARPLPPRRPTIRRAACDVLVVGAGPAGLAAAVAAAEGAARVVLVDESARPGGSLLLAGAAGVAEADELAARFRDADGELLLGTVAFGVYLTDGVGNALASPGVVALVGAERTIEVRPKALVVASGYHETPPRFPGNDLPGIMGARAALILLHRHGVLPGKRAVVLADTPLARRAAHDLRAAGCEVVGVVGAGDWKDARVVEARGGASIEEVALEAAGRAWTERVDLVVSAGDETPRVELLQQAGAPLAWGGAAFTARASVTGAPGVFAAGDVLGGVADPFAHVDAGARVGEAAARYARGVGP